MPSEALIVCRKCKRSTPGDAEFCDLCGAAIASNASPSQALEREWIIGSDPNECQIHVDRPTVSRRHCVLRTREGSYYLQDLNSSNKTYVNSEPIYGEVEVSREGQNHSWESRRF